MFLFFLLSQKLVILTGIVTSNLEHQSTHSSISVKAVATRIPLINDCCDSFYRMLRLVVTLKRPFRATGLIQTILQLYLVALCL